MTQPKSDDQRDPSDSDSSADRASHPGSLPAGPEAPADTGAESVNTSLQGGLLIAMPALQDPNFRRSVTLLLTHNEDGALGIVLGRRRRRPSGRSAPSSASPGAAPTPPTSAAAARASTRASGSSTAVPRRSPMR